MDECERASVAAWVRSAQPEILHDGFAQIDIDSLLDDPPALAVAAALRYLTAAVAAVRATMHDVWGLVVVPLPNSEHVETDCPPLHELLAEPWAYGPGLSVPGLYLMSDPAILGWENVEEYRRPLPTDGCLPAGFAAYYRCWQPEIAYQEYERAVYIRTIGTPT
jgi:hypothetical protein